MNFSSDFQISQLPQAVENAFAHNPFLAIANNPSNGLA